MQHASAGGENGLLRLLRLFRLSFHFSGCRSSLLCNRERKLWPWLREGKKVTLEISPLGCSTSRGRVKATNLELSASCLGPVRQSFMFMQQSFSRQAGQGSHFCRMSAIQSKCHRRVLFLGLRTFVLCCRKFEKYSWKQLRWSFNGLHKKVPQARILGFIHQHTTRETHTHTHTHTHTQNQKKFRAFRFCLTFFALRLVSAVLR